MKWIGLALGIIALSVAIKKGQAKQALLAFVIGALYGFVIDVIGGDILGLWSYKSSIYSASYFLLVVPGWGVFGMFINIFWNQMVGKPWRAFICLTVGLFLVLEIPNLSVQSWTYTIPLWLVAIGWFPLVGTCRLFYILSSDV